MNDWSGFLKRYRRAHSLTQAVLAETLGVEQATVSRWERGFHVPNLGIQHRLRDLLYRRPGASDRVILHRVQCALSAVKLADRNARNLAASPAAARLHGVSQAVLAECDYRPFFSDILADQWRTATDMGFFDGDIASVKVFNTWRPMNGSAPRYCTSYWTPAMLSDGEVLLVSDFAEIDEQSFLAVSPAHRIAITTMDEIFA